MAEQTAGQVEQPQVEVVFGELDQKFLESDRFSGHFDAGIGKVDNVGYGNVFTYGIGIGDKSKGFVEINKYGLNKYGHRVNGQGENYPLSPDDINRVQILYDALQTAGALSDAAKAAGGIEVSGEVAGEAFKLLSATNAANQTVTIVERGNSAYLVTESLDYPIAKANSKDRQEHDKRNVILSIKKVQLPTGERFNIETEDTYQKSKITKEDIDYLAKVPHSLRVAQPV